jgi:hypothetical protein
MKNLVEGMKFKKLMCVTTCALIILLAIPVRLTAQDNQDRKSQLLGERYFSILNGTPMNFQLHHDTRGDTYEPIDVYLMVIEMQVMNSDGNPEPEGLQIYTYITAKPQDRGSNSHNARDCKIWYRAVQTSAPEYDGNTKVYPYLEFITQKGARTVQTIEDGAVLFSDDVECWKSGDRFPPF